MFANLRRSRAFFSISLTFILASCGSLQSGPAGADLEKPAKPQGDTKLSQLEIDMGAMHGFDKSLLQTVKDVVGSTIEPYSQSEDSQFSQILQKKMSEKDSGKDDEAEAPPSAANPGGAPASADAATGAPAAADATATGTATSATATTADNNASPNPVFNQGSSAAPPAPAPQPMPQVAASTESETAKVIGIKAQFKDERNEDIGTRYVEALRKKLPIGYEPFVTEDEQRGEVVAVIKASDPFEMVRVVSTTGGGLFSPKSTDAIVQQLKKWNAKYPLHVVEVKHDTVVALLDSVPPGNEADVLGYEVKKFAPGDGSAHANDFTDDIRQNRRLFLWWD